MRPRPVLAAALIVVSAFTAAQRSGEPFVPMGVFYRPGTPGDAVRTRRELETVRAMGFSSVTIAVKWSEAEPIRGQYRLDALDQLFGIAGEAGLKVIMQLETASPPGWLLRLHPDGRFIFDSTEPPVPPATTRICLDHPGVLAEVVAFVTTVSQRVSIHPAWYGVDVASDFPSHLCRCAHTERRFRAWLKSRPGRSAATDSVNVAMFVALKLRDHAKVLADGAAARVGRLLTTHAAVPSVAQRLVGAWPGQDDWLMNGVVDQYGTSVYPESLSPLRLAFALDGIRSATRDKGWFMTEASRPALSAPEANPRLLGWIALSRGARAVTFADSGVLGNDRTRTAGAFAGIVVRNPALFAPLRPRPSRIAVAYAPHLPGTSADAAARSMAEVYRVLFEHNIQTDLIHVDEVASGIANRYNAVVLTSPVELPLSAAAALKGYVAAGGTLIDGTNATLGDDQIVERSRAAGVTPDVRLDAGHDLVETRFLESSDVIMLIGLNHGDMPQRVTMTFAPDTQEAVWQNMETGAAVNFVAGPDGPTYTYTFRPRDALVLMIKKGIR